MEEEAKQAALAYLNAHHVATLATVGPEGPWASAVFYVNTGFIIYFLTENHTRHGRNLAANSLVAAAIHEDYSDWEEIKGIQLFGKAAPVGAMEKSQVLGLFIQKFSSLKTFLRVPDYLKIVTRAQVYRLTPQELWYLDNQKGFSSRQKVL
ncbi:MAG: pyridoxamine 5'-phosphate oxidase family protein [Bacillota bacterium]